MIIVALLLSATPQADVAAPPKPAKPQVICRSVTPTGSRLGGTRVCRTAAEWRDSAAIADREVRRMQNGVRSMNDQ